MAGSLIKIDEEIVTSAVASVDLENVITTNDVYMLTFHNVTGTTDGQNVRARFKIGSTQVATSTYDGATKQFKANTTFANNSFTGQNKYNLYTVGTGTSETIQGIWYIYNAYNSSEYTFVTTEYLALDNTPNLAGEAGGFVETTAQETNGFRFFMQSGNIASGTFTVYQLQS
jgi:hypothetical protein